MPYPLAALATCKDAHAWCRLQTRLHTIAGALASLDPSLLMCALGDATLCRYALSVPLAWIELLDGGGSLGQLPSTARFGTYTVQ